MPQALSPKSENSTDSGESCKPATEPFKCNEDDVLDKQKKEETGDISSGTPTWDQSNTAKAHKDDELRSSAACSAEIVDPHDSGGNLQSRVELSESGTVHEGEENDKGTEKNEERSFVPAEADTVKTKKDELESLSTRSAESQDPHDSGENLQSTVHLSKSGAVPEDDVFDQENDKGTEKSKERSFVPDQADTVKTKKDERESSSARSAESPDPHDSGENPESTVELSEGDTVYEGAVIYRENEKGTEKNEECSLVPDQADAVKTEKDELESSSARSAESEDPYDSGQNLQSTVELSKSGKVHEGAVIDLDNEKETEKNEERSFVPDQADDVKTKKDELDSSSDHSSKGQDPHEAGVNLQSTVELSGSGIAHEEAVIGADKPKGTEKKVEPPLEPDQSDRAKTQKDQLESSSACSAVSVNPHDSGENVQSTVELTESGTVHEGAAVDQEKGTEKNEERSFVPAEADTVKTKKDELELSSAPPAESEDPHDSGESLQSTVELTTSGRAHEGAVIDQEKDKGTDENEERSFGPPEADTVKTEKDELESLNPNSNDGSGCLSQDPEETKPTAPSSSACFAAPQENASTPDKGATSDMNQPEPEHLPDVRDIRDCSFQDVIHYLRRVGGQTEREMVKVDAQCLIENLGEENAKKLVTFFNQQSNSMDLVITDGVWGFNRVRTATDEGEYKEIPEWCLMFLRKLVIQLYANRKAMLEDLKEQCEDACGILKEALHDMDVNLHKANEIHEATMNNMKEDLRRAKADHKKMLEKHRHRDEVSRKNEQEKIEDAHNSTGESFERQLPGNTTPCGKKNEDTPLTNLMKHFGLAWKELKSKAGSF